MKLKKLWSYVWPQTTKIVSDHNGVLEVTYYQGKKMLDSKNANYSYGSLQKILEFGLDKIDISKLNSVLLLGLGAGSAVHSLRHKYQYPQKITAVEFDKKVIDIAKHRFDVQESHHLQIIHQDAFTFIQEHKQQYDLVMVDVFIDQKVPKPFYSQVFCEYLYNTISPKGNLIFNLGMEQYDEVLQKKVAQYFLSKPCKVHLHQRVLKTNNILIAHL